MLRLRLCYEIKLCSLALWHGSACVRTGKLSRRQNRWLHPNSLQGPRVARPHLGQIWYGLPRPRPCQGPLVPDRELVLRPWFWLCFAFCCRLKPQMLHGDACSGLKGGSVSGGVPRGRLPPPRPMLSCAGCGMAPAGPAGLTARGQLA